MEGVLGERSKLFRVSVCLPVLVVRRPVVLHERSLLRAILRYSCFLLALDGSKATAGERNPADQLHSVEIIDTCLAKRPYSKKTI